MRRALLGLALLMTWGTTLPAAPSPAAFTAAESYSRSRGQTSLLVWENGKILRDSGDPRAHHTILSITKTLTCLALLRAQAEGRLSLDERASATLTEWRNDPLRSRITLRQMLTQTSGLDPANHALYSRGLADKNRAALNVRSVAPPGTRFAYGPSNFEPFGEILRRRCGVSARGYIESRVMNPLGMSSDGWRLDRAGNAYLSTGASLTSRDLLALGRHLLGGAGGLLPRDAFRGTPPNPTYGLTFWLNVNASRRDARVVDVESVLENDPPFRGWSNACMSRNAPSELIALIGSRGQRVYLVPSKRLIIVRQGSDGRFQDAPFLDRLFAR